MRLTDEQRAGVTARLGDTAGYHWVGWPEWAPKQRNGCNEYCDMWTGACICGATHQDGR